MNDDVEEFYTNQFYIRSVPVYFVRGCFSGLKTAAFGGGLQYRVGL